MKPSYKFYKLCFRVLRPVIGICYRIRVTGRENICDGKALVCANHSSSADPFLIAFAFGVENHMHMIAKIELFRKPVLSQILQKMGMISVDRATLDMSTIKKTYKLFDNNEKVVIFPEGTRVSRDDAATAKSGAIKLAEHTDTPLIPLYLPRKKPPFRRVPVVIGEPYYIKKQDKKRSEEEYARLADELMKRIGDLGHNENH